MTEFPPPDRLDDLERALELLDMEPVDAARARWEDGRVRYGDDWHGRHPLLEAYLEGVDQVNYLEESYRRGELDELVAGELIAAALDVALGIRTAALGVRAEVLAAVHGESNLPADVRPWRAFCGPTAPAHRARGRSADTGQTDPASSMKEPKP